MNQEQGIIVRDDSTLTCSATQAARDLVEHALATLAAVPTEIDTPKEQAIAVAAQMEAAKVLKAIEAARKGAKGPVWDLCQKIDRMAEDLTKELGPEKKAVDNAIGAYQMREAERACEAARQRQAELDRIERERQQELERIRKEAEAKLAQATTPKEAKAIERQTEAAAQIATERATQQVEAAPSVVAPPKVKGQSIRPTWCFEVVDMHLLYRTNPGLVRLEANRQEILELLNRGITTIPGLRTWNEFRAGVRTAGQAPAINV